MSIENKNEGPVLGFSSPIVIELPQIEKPNFEEGSKPHKYWDIYNRGVSFYEKKMYEQSKDEFLKLLVYENPHKTIYSYMLRVYRKIIRRNIENQKFQNAYEIYQEFFGTCKDFISNNDRCNYNKLIENLPQKNPDYNYCKIEIVSEKKKPDFEILETKRYSISRLNEVEIKKENLYKASWAFIGRTGSDIVYVKCFYNNKLSKYDKATIILKDEKGNIKKEFVVNHGIYRFKATENSDKFVASSDDMVLYLYTVQGDCCGTYNLKRFSKDKYHVRCVDISPEGDFIVFTHIDRAYIMDSNFKLLGNWRTSNKEGTKVVIFNHDEEDKRKWLSLLGLNGNPSKNEIKAAFRKKILKYHPDKNPDPNTTEKTREIITAYEKLTGEDAKQALDSFKIEMTMTIGSGEDWIYASYIGHHADRIYLGCFSGKVYCISKTLHIIKQYICHDDIKSIREKGRNVFVETAFVLFIIQDDRYLTHINIWGMGKLRWNTEGFMYVSEKEIHLFTDDGIEIGRIVFDKNKIYNVYYNGNSLKVTTAYKTYTFMIS